MDCCYPLNDADKCCSPAQKPLLFTDNGSKILLQPRWLSLSPLTHSQSPPLPWGDAAHASSEQAPLRRFLTSASLTPRVQAILSALVKPLVAWVTCSSDQMVPIVQPLTSSSLAIVGTAGRGRLNGTFANGYVPDDRLSVRRPFSFSLASRASSALSLGPRSRSLSKGNRLTTVTKLVRKSHPAPIMLLS